MKERAIGTWQSKHMPTSYSSNRTPAVYIPMARRLQGKLILSFLVSKEIA